MAEALYKEIFKSPPEIETEHLIFRKMTRDYTEDMYAYASKEEVSAYLLWKPHSSKDYTYSYLCYIENLYKRGEFYDWAVILKENGRMIGTGGFTVIDMKNSMGEIGYVLNSEYWNRGFGTEIARELLSFGFNVLGFHRIQARYMSENVHSRLVMEKCGMHFEGVLRGLLFVKGRYVDVGYFSILKEEYFQNNPQKEYKFSTPSRWYERLFGEGL